MNREFKITIEELDAEFTTDSPFKAFAYLTATEHYDFDSGLSQEIAELCYEVYINENKPLNALNVIDYICENYEDLPNDFNDLCDVVYNGVTQYDL
jgi:hypothetical protein